MRTRVVLSGLLLLATALFAAGAVAEHHTHAERAPRVEHAESAEEHAGEEHLAGLNAESTPLVVLGIVAGLGLAGIAARRSDRRRTAVLAFVAVAALGWAALDVRE